MREVVTPGRLQDFMRALGAEARASGRVFFTGGATALLFGWRETTVDVDLRIVPDADAVLRAIPRIKESLRINVELACPSDFIPELPGWQDRSLFIAQEGHLSFFHYDPYAQVLSKIERGHARDVADVQAMFRIGLVKRVLLRDLYERIEPDLYRYPAIDPDTFRRGVERTLDETRS